VSDELDKLESEFLKRAARANRIQSLVSAAFSGVGCFVMLAVNALVFVLAVWAAMEVLGR
jgi:hypothetical protein